MDPATMMMLASLASSAAGAAGVGATPSTTGTMPFQWLQNPEYAGQSQKMGTANDFYTNQIAGMNANGGQLPPALLKLLQQMQQGMSTQNREQFFGTPGQRSGSIMDSARSTGAAMGVGPKATQAQVSKQLGNFQSAEKQIMQYISGLGVQQGASWMNSILGNANAAPQGPQGQWGGGQAYQTQGSNPLGQLGAAGMAAAPWMNSGAFNPTAGAGAQPGVIGSGGNGMNLPGMMGSNDMNSYGVDFSLDNLLNGPGSAGSNFGQNINNFGTGFGSYGGNLQNSQNQGQSTFGGMFGNSINPVNQARRGVNFINDWVVQPTIKGTSALINSQVQTAKDMLGGL